MGADFASHLNALCLSIKSTVPRVQCFSFCHIFACHETTYIGHGMLAGRNGTNTAPRVCTSVLSELQW